MLEHKTRMSELNHGEGAVVDTSIVPLVKFVTKLGFETVLSSAGEGNFPVAYVKFTGSDYKAMAEFLFGQISPMVAHLGTDVTLALNCVGGHYEGAILMGTNVLEEVTKRFGCWVEMLHK